MLVVSQLLKFPNMEPVELKDVYAEARRSIGVALVVVERLVSCMSRASRATGLVPEGFSVGTLVSDG